MYNLVLPQTWWEETTYLKTNNLTRIYTNYLIKLSMYLSIHTWLHTATNWPIAVLRCAEKNNDYGDGLRKKYLYQG
jgi:hypothetical protein